MKPAGVKICGITQPQQAESISLLGVGALGYVLHEPSPRYVAPHIVAECRRAATPFCAQVAVVVDKSTDELRDIQRLTGITHFQLHGSESPEYCRALSEMGISWIKAFRVGTDFDYSCLELYPDDTFLLDAWSANAHGGTGVCLDWSALQSLSERYRIILAGGLRADNAKIALSQCTPIGLDVSSGVESAPGVKCIAEVMRFLSALEECA